MTPAQAEWARCREWIREAVEPSGLRTIEDVEAEIAAGTMHFWPGNNAAAVTQIVPYPRCKVLAVFAVGGRKGKALRELVREIEPALCRFAAAAGCTKIMGCGMNPNWRPICEGMGYAHLWTVMSKDLA